MHRPAIDIKPEWPAAHRAALERAMRIAPSERVDRVSDNAWATTYRLSGPRGSTFLKLLPSVQRPQIPRLAQLAEELPDSGPRLLAVDVDAGWVLSADHGGRDTRTYDGRDERPAMLRHYAGLQARAAQAAPLLARLEPIDLRAVPGELMDFLRGPAEAGEGGRVGAAYFLGSSAARRYLRLLEARIPVLLRLIDAAVALPPTACHGDFQLRNVAMRQRRDPVVFDWDDVAAGPAGLCLHGMLDGCAAAVVAVGQLRRGRGAARSPAARALSAYVWTLASHGYARRKDLLSALPGAIVAGTMRFVTSYGRFPGESSRGDSGSTIARKCSELLDVCDWLACADPAAADAASAAYEADGEWHRAQRIVQDQLSRLAVQPTGMLLRYARLSRASGDTASAEQAAREVVERDPGCVEARLILARSLLERLELDGSAAVVEPLVKGRAGGPDARVVRRRVREFSRLRRVSLSPRGWPRLGVSAAERERGRLDRDTLAMAIELFRRQGAVQLDGVFSPDAVLGMQRRFLERYRAHFHDGRHPDALQVGDKRYMITVELDELFGSAEVIASGLLMPLVRDAVGEDCILSAYNAVASLPGSADQNIHRDHLPLFERDAPGLRHPSFAVQVILPLVPLDSSTGTTRMIKGAQWAELREAARMPFQDPVVPLGSCLLNDYLCPHYGIGNRSATVRPIVCYIYTRPWFRDYLNYHNQPALRMAPGFLERAPAEVTSLVGWWERERRQAALLP